MDTFYSSPFPATSEANSLSLEFPTSQEKVRKSRVNSHRSATAEDETDQRVKERTLDTSLLVSGVKEQLQVQKKGKNEKHHEKHHENHVDRTYRGLVNYGQQIAYCGKETLLAAAKALTEQALKENSPQLVEAIEELKIFAEQQSDESFIRIRERAPLNGQARQEKKKKASLNASLKQPLDGLKMSHQEKLQIKKEIRKIEKESLAITTAFCNQVLKQARHLDPKKRQKLQECVKKIKVEAPLHLNNQRQKLIHRQKEWQTEKWSDYPVTLKSPKGTVTTFTSSFIAKGKAYSSILLRNRQAAEAHPANFHASQLSDKEGKSLFYATRSASLVEFSLDKRKEREASTQKNVKVVLDEQLQHLFLQKKLPGQEITSKEISGKEISGTKENPFILSSQKIQLVTPDLPRHLAMKISQKLLKRANNERLLCKETIEAYEYWAKETLTQPIAVKVKDQNGIEREIYVKYELSTFSLPCNRTSEKMYGSKLLRPFINHQKSERANLAALNHLQIKTEQKLTALDAQIAALLAKEEGQQFFDQLAQVAKEKSDLRQILAAASKQERPQALENWQKAAEKLAQMVALEKNLSPALLACFKLREQIEDARQEIEELVYKKAQSNLQLVNYNRYALGSRILYLGSLIGIEHHFSCRSGKDRTGLQDLEAKLLIAQIAMEGRFISFHEAEKRKSQTKQRKEMLLHSGNGDYNPKANLGLAWWNLSGAQLTTKDIQLKELYSRLVSGSHLFKRFKTGPTSVLKPID